MLVFNYKVGKLHTFPFFMILPFLHLRASDDEEGYSEVTDNFLSYMQLF